MGDFDVNRIENALKGIVIGTVTNLKRAEQAAYDDGLQEREEQFQVAISGLAEEFFKWELVTIKFGTAFVDATGNRDSELTQPHFTCGTKIDTPTPVGVLGSVMEWITTERNETIGCVLAIGVCSTDQATKFKGALHCTFQGYGQPILTFGEEADVGDE